MVTFCNYSLLKYSLGDVIIIIYSSLERYLCEESWWLITWWVSEQSNGGNSWVTSNREGSSIPKSWKFLTGQSSRYSVPDWTALPGIQIMLLYLFLKPAHPIKNIARVFEHWSAKHIRKAPYWKNNNKSNWRTLQNLKLRILKCLIVDHFFREKTYETFSY